MKTIQPTPGLTIKFKYCGKTVIGQVKTIVSGHMSCYLLRDYISNAGKQHKAGEKQLFILKDLTDVSLFDESIQ